MKIVLKLRREDSIWQKYIKKLEKFGEVYIIFENKIYENLVLFMKCDILITTNLSIDLLNKMQNLKALFIFKSGFENIPVNELKRRNIVFFNSNANSKNIAEHAIALALSLLHRINEFHSDLQNGIWYSDTKNYFWKSIGDLNVGILGYGSIGSEIYKMLSSMVKKIYIIDRGKKYPKGIKLVDGLDELINKCNLVFISLPLNDENVNLLCEEKLKMFKGKYIINISRAHICDEYYLFKLLENGYIKGFASDVWYKEANKNDKKDRILPSKYDFHKLPNVLMSPHCATHEYMSHEKYISDIMKKCLNFLKNCK